MPVRPLWFVFLSCLLFAESALLDVSSHAQAAPQVVAKPRVTSIIDETSLVTLTGNTHPLAQSKFDAGPAPVSMPAKRLLLVLARSTQQEADLQTWLQSVQDVNSPDFHKFLSPDEFGRRFGVGDMDLQTVQTWLTGHGFTIHRVARGHTAIEFSGTAGQVESAFHTPLHAYMIDGQRFYANARDPRIPSALSPVVAGFAALNSFKPKAQYTRGPSGHFDAANHTITPAYTLGDSNSGYYIYLGPADFATIYDTPTALNPNLSGTAYDGTGVTIGIAGDSNIDITQNANYRATFGLSPKATKVVVDGLDPGENGDAVEAYLDTQVAGGVAPNANVILYTAADTDYQSGLFLAINRAIDDNQADILNVSFGACEAAYGTSGNLFVNNLWEQAAAQGITVTVSSGDSGAAGCDNPDAETLAQYGLAVNAIGSSPYNISVGGTDYDVLSTNFPTGFTNYVDISNTLAQHRSALKYIPEAPWNDSTYPNTSVALNKALQALTGNSDDNNIAAAGGGISYIYPTPTWQSTFATGTGRNLPDVSFLAGNGFYGALWGICTDADPAAPADCAAGATANNFFLTGIGGTSASAPAFAGILALVMQKTGSRLGQADYALYDLAKTKYSTVFHDVAVGNNSVNCVPNSAGCARNSNSYYFLTGYNATAGYDPASGLGSVDATNLVSNWPAASFTPTTSSLMLDGATSPLSITHGQSVAVSATVTGSGVSPSGSVALVDSLTPASHPNSEGIQVFALSSGSVSGTTTYLPGGSYNVTAHYGGSTTFAQSDSNSIPVTVAPEDSTTKIISVDAYDAGNGNKTTAPKYGFTFLIDATPYGNSASLANPNGAATGTMTFLCGATVLGTSPLDSTGTAEFVTTQLPAGVNSLTASYSGDASFNAGTSAPLSYTVSPATTTLVGSAPSFSGAAGNSLNLGASLFNSDGYGNAPTGTVTFKNGSQTLATVPLIGTPGSPTTPLIGQAFFSTQLLPAGSNSIVASYSGDNNFSPSVSTPDTVLVSPSIQSITVVPASSPIAVNQPLQVVVTVGQTSGLPAATGTILLSTNGYASPAVSLVNGAATITVPANSLPVGPDTLTATYSGDLYYASRSGSALVSVNSTGLAQSTVIVTPAQLNVTAYPVSVVVSVTGTVGNPPPTGLLSVSVNNQLVTTAPVVNGAATLSLQGSNFQLPSDTISATYYGDTVYAAASNSVTVTAPVLINPIFQVTPLGETFVVDQPLSVIVTLLTIGNGTTASVPTGTVYLSSGTYTSPPASLVNGSASITIPPNSLAVGADTVTAVYSGDANYYNGFTNVIYTATAVPPDFTVGGTSVTVTPGSTTGNTSTITLTPSGGFVGTVSLTAALTSSPTGAINLPTFSFGSGTVATITSSSPVTATLTVRTTAPFVSTLKKPGIGWLGGGAVLAGVLLFGIKGHRRRWQSFLGMLLLLVFIAGGVSSCGGGGGGGGGGGTQNPGTTAGTYTVTVTGTSGNITASTTVSLTVQ